MNDTTNNFIQNTSGFKTSNKEEGKLPYRIVNPKINYPKESGFTFEQVEINEAPDMTKGQWKKYYKRMGLE